MMFARGKEEGNINFQILSGVLILRAEGLLIESVQYLLLLTISDS